jgi:hypothetical protein
LYLHFRLSNVQLQLRIRKDQDSYLGLETGFLTETFGAFPQFLQANVT